MLSQLTYRLKEVLGIPFYTKPQSFRVSVRMRLQNEGQGPRVAHLILPIPQNTRSQHVEEESFSHSVKFFHDDRFGNRIATFDMPLAEKEAPHVSASFRVTTAPLRISLDVRGGAHTLSRNERNTYCAPNPFFESDSLKRLAHTARARHKSTKELIQWFNRYVIGYLTYGDPIKGLHSAGDAIEKRVVDCGGFDTMLAALCISCDIPARIVSGFWAGHAGREMMHAWCEIMLPDGAWVPADPSIEYLVRHGRDRTKSGRLGYVGSDRIVFSYGCALPLDGGRTADILQYPFLVESEGVVLDTQYSAERL